MPAAPTEILDAFESILDIFLSDIRHRERAAYFLCDNLVEMACKTKHTQQCRRNGTLPNTRCQFHEALQLPGCRFSHQLRDRLQRRRDTRNLMQHQNAAVVILQQVPITPSVGGHTMAFLLIFNLLGASRERQLGVATFANGITIGC